MCALLIVAGATYGLLKISERYPAVYASFKYKTGVGGLLLLFLAGEVTILFRMFWQCAFFLVKLNSMHAPISDKMIILFFPIATVLLTVTILYQITVKRCPSAVAFSIVSLWVSGPVFMQLQGWFYSMPVPANVLLQVLGWTFVWTVYLVVSPRAALTYGTKRAKHYL